LPYTARKKLKHSFPFTKEELSINSVEQTVELLQESTTWSTWEESQPEQSKKQKEEIVTFFRMVMKTTENKQTR
jgi:hypothetical protein